MSAPDPRKHLERLGDPLAGEYYRLLRETGMPWATRCSVCADRRFPPLGRCPACGGRTEWVELGNSGTLHAFTTQESALRFRAPAVLALVEIGGIVIPAITDDAICELRIGDQIEVEVRPEAGTGLVILAFRRG